MTRIADQASVNTVIARMLDTQARLNDLQVQLSSEKKSQDYQGIARDSERLVKFENSRDSLQAFIVNNEIMDMRLQTSDSVLDGIDQTMNDFRESLYDYEAGSLTNEQRVKDIQDAAFRALTDLEVHLNSDVGGRFMFAGGRVSTQPVDLGLTSLSAFQTKYDGEAVVYPPTRAAHVQSNDSVGNADTGNLTISGTNTIAAATAGSLAGFAVGSTITLAGSVLGNDDTYTVVSNDGTTMTIAGTMTFGANTVTVNNTIANGAETGATISASSYYGGDTSTQTHRVSENREFNLDVNAIDPAFDKAIRAMALIAQGVYGTAGGLDQNLDRLDDAIYLVNAAMDAPPTGTPPYGTELTSNLAQIQQDIGFERLLISRTNESNQTLIGFFDNRIIETENADTLEVTTELLDQSNALEASYRALARIQQLSLTDFL
jgi:flagellar hook-associated protein 3 FlgL